MVPGDLRPTADPRKILSAVISWVRTFGVVDGEKALHDYLRACLRIARKAGRLEERRRREKLGS